MDVMISPERPTDFLNRGLLSTIFGVPVKNLQNFHPRMRDGVGIDLGTATVLYHSTIIITLPSMVAPFGSLAATLMNLASIVAHNESAQLRAATVGPYFSVVSRFDLAPLQGASLLGGRFPQG